MPANHYVIIRDDLAVDAVTIITDGLLIGRLPQCELLLNHPSVSRVQAGIKQFEASYYLFALRPKNPVILNGKPVEENEAIAAGDIIEVGPFHVQIDSADDALVSDEAACRADRGDKGARHFLGQAYSRRWKDDAAFAALSEGRQAQW